MLETENNKREHLAGPQLACSRLRDGGESEKSFKNKKTRGGCTFKDALKTRKPRSQTLTMRQFAYITESRV